MRWPIEPGQSGGRAEMKIAVLGAGAMGSLMGAYLSRVHDVTLVGRKEQVLAIRERGLRIVGLEAMTCWPEAMENLEEIDTPDMIVLTVKAFDTERALPTIDRVRNDQTIVISLQNGIDNHFLIAERIPRAVSGLTSWGATLVEPGKVRFAGRGDMILGSIAGEMGDVDKVAQAFRLAGIECRVSSIIESEIWMKAIVNACINPITALVRRENQCLREPSLFQIAEMACDEAVRVSKRAGVNLPEEDPFERVMEVVDRTAENRSSMLQDIERGRRTEIDEINGSIVRRGENMGVPTPVNMTLWRLVRYSANSPVLVDHK
jgi:2-dehydropantoate 2-reductase